MKQEVQRFSRFLVVGLLNSAVGFSCIVVAKVLLGWSDGGANAFGYLLGLCCGFLLNRSWTFKQTGSQPFEQAARYLVTFLISYIINLCVLGIGLHVLELNSYAAQLLTMPAYSVCFYLLCKTWVFQNPIRDRGAGPVALATVLVIGILCVPITQALIPPLADYPNHLARTYIAHHLEQDSTLQAFYVFEWRLITNTLWDVAMAALLPISGDLYLAGRLLLGIYMALWVTGAVALHRVWSGRWSYVPLLVSLFAYNGTFVAGFVVFGIGTGLALWAATGWHLLLRRPVWVRLLYGVVSCSLLYLVHLFALGFFGLLAGGSAVHSVWTRHRNRETNAEAARDAWLHLGITLVMALPALALHASNPAPQGENGAFEMTHITDLSWLAYAPFPPAVTFYVGVGLALLYTAIRERERLCPEAALPMLALVLIWLICPRHIYGTFFVSARFILLFAVLLPIAWSPPAPHNQRPPTIFYAGMMLLLVNVTIHTVHWRNYRAVVDEMMEITALIPSGSHLEHLWKLPPSGPALTSDDVPWINPLDSSLVPHVHISALATIERQAFVPSHFTHPPKHLLRATDAYKALDRAQSGPLKYQAKRDEVGADIRLFDHPDLASYDYMLLSPAPNLSDDDEAYHGDELIYQGRWLWLAKRPTPEVTQGTREH